MNSHLKTAYEYGVKKALEKLGYASTGDVQKDAQALGLGQPAQPQKTANEQGLNGLFASLKAKLS